MKHSSSNRLNIRHLEHFTGETLFDRIARAVCGAECLPRKELYESWEVARRIHRRIKGMRLIDLACGHALLPYIMLLLDRSIPEAIAIDCKIPASAKKLAESLSETWPTLAGKITLQEKDIADADIRKNDLLVSVHGCGNLTDQIIDLAIENGAHLALLPCCHDLKRSETGNLEGWLEPTMAVDVMRVARLQSAGYNINTGLIPETITPKNRLLIATRA